MNVEDVPACVVTHDIQFDARSLGLLGHVFAEKDAPPPGVGHWNLVCANCPPDLPCGGPGCVTLLGDLRNIRTEGFLKGPALERLANERLLAKWVVFYTLSTSTGLTMQRRIRKALYLNTGRGSAVH